MTDKCLQFSATKITSSVARFTLWCCMTWPDREVVNTEDVTGIGIADKRDTCMQNGFCQKNILHNMCNWQHSADKKCIEKQLCSTYKYRCDQISMEILKTEQKMHRSTNAKPTQV